VAVDRALSQTAYIAGDELTIADIGIACDLAQFLRERLMADRVAKTGFAPISTTLETDYPRVAAHLAALAARPVFSDYLGESIEQTLVAR
jgi:glutathione S-transferase